jgi:hypothetical protein
LITKISCLCFLLGVPVNGVEDPVVPSVLGLDVLLEVWTAGSQVEASGNVAGDGDAICGKAGFGSWDKRDDLGGFGPLHSKVICGMGISVAAAHLGIPGEVFHRSLLVLMSSRPFCPDQSATLCL